MNNMNKIGPKTDPWGTPYWHNSKMSDRVLLVTTYCFLFDK